jgi:hypothetical protein
MFQFAGLAATRLWIQRALIRVPRDHHSFVNSPGLIADFHALHRLLTPRHPPYALRSLTTIIQNSRYPAELRQASLVDSLPSIPVEVVITLPTTISIRVCPRSQSLSCLLSRVALYDEAKRHPCTSHTGQACATPACLLHGLFAPSEDAYYLYYNQIVKDHQDAHSSAHRSCQMAVASALMDRSRIPQVHIELSSPSSTRSGKRLASIRLACRKGQI